MDFLKKKRFKPFFKQTIKLRENIFNNKKILKFKKEKWKLHLIFYLKKLKRYKKYKPLDQYKNFITKHSTRNTGYKKRYKNTFEASKRLKIFYGNLLKKYLKKQIKNTFNTENKNHKVILLTSLERKLNIILFRAKFSTSLREANQLITHGKIKVNKRKIKNKSYLLKPGDIVSLDKKYFNLYDKNIIKSNKWPIPPKHLLINYKTMQILFINNSDNSSLLTNYPFNLKLQKILTKYSKQ